MASAIETVQAFCDQWRISRESVTAAFNDYFTPETIWENVGFSKTTGPAEAITLMETFEKASGIALADIEMLSIAVTGNTVLTERIDHMLSADGKRLATLRIMGAIEVNEAGKITAWRDYFDTKKLG